MVLDFTHDLRDFVLLALDLVKTILILSLALAQIALVDFYLLVKDLGLLVSSDQLGSQDVSLGHHQVVFFLQFLSVLLTFFYDLMQFLYFLRLQLDI